MKRFEYLYLVESNWENGKVRQSVLYYFGRRDKVDRRSVKLILEHFQGKRTLTRHQMDRLRKRPPRSA